MIFLGGFISMDVKNCKRCRRLFNYISGQPICPACREELEAEFQKVKKYIQDHRNATVAQVAEECEVEESQIRQWVREERLMFAEGSVSGIACEVCGTPITSGRFCDKCKAGMINDLSRAGRQPKVAEQPKITRTTRENKMRFLNQ